MGVLPRRHDHTPRAIVRSRRLFVVALNNSGGALFSFPPGARHKEFFEPYFGTPLGVAFEGAAKMFGLAYELPRTTEEFVEAYGAAVTRNAPTLIEVRTAREENVALRSEERRVGYECSSRASPY